MKVRCVKIINPVTGETEDTNPWVRKGKEYVVLEVVAAPGRHIDFRVVTDDDARTPGLHSAEMFESVSSRVPSNWVIQVEKGGVVTIGPERWLRRGFWEDYFDQKPDAIAVYAEELDRVVAEAD